MHAPQKQDFCLSVQCWILNSSWNLIGTQIIFKQMIRTTIISFSSLRNIFVKDGNTPQPHDGTFRTLKAVLSLGKNSFLAQCLHNSLEQTYFCCLTYIFLICKCLSGSTHSVGSMCSPWWSSITKHLDHRCLQRSFGGVEIDPHDFLKTGSSSGLAQTSLLQERSPFWSQHPLWTLGTFCWNLWVGFNLTLLPGNSWALVSLSL